MDSSENKKVRIGDILDEMRASEIPQKNSKTEDANIDQLLDEISVGQLTNSSSELRIHKEFLHKIEDLYRGLFEKSFLGQTTLGSELKYGFGQAMGSRLVHWAWDALEPRFEADSHLQPSLLEMRVPAKLHRRYSELLAVIGPRFFKETGVELPQPLLLESEEPRLFIGGKEVAELPALEIQLRNPQVLDHRLRLHAWRFLTIEACLTMLRKLWNRRPGLHQVFLESRLQEIDIFQICRRLLQWGYPILYFDAVVECSLLEVAEGGYEGIYGRARSVAMEFMGEKFLNSGSIRKEYHRKNPPALEALGTVSLFELRCCKTLRELWETGSRPSSESFQERLRSEIAAEDGWVPPRIDRSYLSSEEREVFCNGRYRVLIRGEVVEDGTINLQDENLDPARELHLALKRLTKRYAHRLLSYNALGHLLKFLGKQDPSLLAYFEGDSALVSKLHRVMICLLEEGVSLRDRATILETVVEFQHSSPEDIVEIVRERMPAFVCRDLLDENGHVALSQLDAELEMTLSESLRPGRTGEARLALTEELNQKLLKAVSEASKGFLEDGLTPSFLTTPELRRPLFNYFRHLDPRPAFLTAENIPRRMFPSQSPKRAL